MESPGSTTEISPWQRLKRHFSEAFSEQFEFRRDDGQESGENRLSRKRGRDAYRYVMLLLAAVLVPMFLHDLYTDRVILALASFLLLAILLANIGLLSTNRPAFLPPFLLLTLGIGLILLAVGLGQWYSVYWLYPLLAGLPVLLRARRALIIGLACGIVALPMIWLQFEPSAAVVISVSMVLTWLVSAWLVFAVTEQSRRLRSMAITDPLTGAYNRRYLEEQARQAMDLWQRYRHSSTILIIDIDYFKRVNDRYGHAVGDSAIKQLVAVISGRIRAVDTLCRFGGEEFVVLLKETGVDSAARIAEELRGRVERAKILPEGSMTISIGVCEVIAAESVDQWFKLADSALYLAKRSGRNRVEIARVVPVAAEPRARTVPDWR